MRCSRKVSEVYEREGCELERNQCWQRTIDLKWVMVLGMPLELREFGSAVDNMPPFDIEVTIRLRL